MCDIGTAFTAISTGVSMMGFFQQQKYDNREEMYRQQALEMQRRQQEENAKQAMLAAQQRINDRKRQALQQAKTNKASFAASGVNLDSPSFGAFFKSSKKIVKQDISRIQINGLTDVVNYQSEARQTGLAKEASLSGAKSRATAAKYGAIGEAIGTAGTLAQAGYDWYKDRQPD
tara:strand:- start:7370 stop:7891 length:522 start_codon:yes stop_codon:yes gene_type:complete